VFGYPLEYLNPANFRRWNQRFGCQDPQETYRQIKTRRTSGNGVFGVKVHYSHLAKLHAVEKRVREYRPIQLVRRDKLRQAVSYERAAQTKAWISEMPSLADAKYDFGRVYARLLSIVEDEARWEAYFLSLRLAPLSILYEDFVADPDAVAERCCAYLDVKPLGRQPRVAFLPSRQADGINADWLERFLADAPAKMSEALIDKAEAKEARTGKANRKRLLAKLMAAFSMDR
jgi:LPS sulfotransferase NodH